MEYLAEVVFSGVASKIINDMIDLSNLKDRIINAVKNKNNREQNKESQLYNVVVNTLNQFTYNRYEDNQEKIFEAAEILIRESREKGEGKAVKDCLQTVGFVFNEQECRRLKILLYEMLGKNEYSELYHLILLSLVAERCKYNDDVIEQLKLKLDEAARILNNRKAGHDEGRNCFKRKIKSRTKEYADKWDDNMFLNSFNERDEIKGINIALKEVYLENHLPYYIWGENRNNSHDLKDLLAGYVEKGENDKTKNLLILGQPGIGKSTLITWILSNFPNRREDILVYQFASDLKDIDWDCTAKEYMYWDNILNAIGLDDSDLRGKVFIFDGFDEIEVRINRIDILNKLLYKEIRNMPADFSVIVTCRVNYIHGMNRIKYDYITLQPWNEEQIKSFCKIYCEKNKSKISDNSLKNIIINKDILGIPLILYMALALDITVEEENSMVDIYDKIFSLDGGIYDRCIDHKNFADAHRIGEIKKQIHQVSREIAFWMFENEPDKAFIPQEEYQKICSRISEENKEENLEKDVIIGNFFKLKHCEGKNTNELYFVHRSIYEYFVVDFIYSSMYEVIHSQEPSKERLAGVFGWLFKKGKLSQTICDFFEHEIELKRLENAFKIVCDTFNLMMQDGMSYNAQKNYEIYCRNVINCEIKIFANMLDFLHLWNPVYLKVDSLVCEYLKHNTHIGLNLRNMILDSEKESSQNEQGTYVMNEWFEKSFMSLEEFPEKHLKKMSLSGAYLEGADLRKSNLSGADLRRVDFRDAKLSEADLIVAYLSGAILSGAHLDEADLSGADLDGAILRNAGLEGAYLIETDLSRADLGGADLRKANLRGANLSGTDLRKADLRGVYLSGADLSRADLREAKFEENQIVVLELQCELNQLHEIKIYPDGAGRKMEYQDFIRYQDYIMMKKPEK